MGLEQSTLGKIILSCGSVAFVYYSIWLLSAPFVDEESLLARAFPAKHLASALPIILGSALFCLIVFNVGWSLVGAHPVFQAPKHRVVNEALHACAIRHEDGSITSIVSGGRMCVNSGGMSANGTSGTSSEMKEDMGASIDVAALEECLNAAIKNPESASTEPGDADEGAWAWVPDWVGPQLGAGVSVLCMVFPDESMGNGFPVRVTGDCEDEHCAAPDGPLVQYLPPLCVSVHCTTGYPDDGPALEVYAPWLEAGALEDVARALRAAAVEQGAGSPVMLTWLECVKIKATQSLEAVTVRPGCGGFKVRSLPGCDIMLVAAEQPPDPEGVLAILRAHDCSAREAAFASQLHRCAICFDDRPGADGIKAPCGHWHCKECMRSMAMTCILASDPTAIRCPQPDCRTELDPVTLQELLDADEMARWDALMLQHALAKMSDVVFCPRCEVPAIEHADWALCPGCNYAFCSLCYDGYHPGIQCATPEEKLRLLDERSKCMDITRRTAKEMLQHRKLRQQLADEAFVRKSAKSCPHCGAAIQKNGGCNKVVCAICKGAMCWQCNAAVEGYAHFRTAACVLIDDELQLEWEREWDRLRAAHQQPLGPAHAGAAEQGAGGVLGMRCLQCGQFCVKVARNNHVKCVWCRADCCFSCKTLLRGRRAVKDHFGARKCPQHS